MHYPRTIFGKLPWDETVIPKDSGAQVGQRIKLSDPDILQAKKLYRCPGKCKIFIPMHAWKCLLQNAGS